MDDEDYSPAVKKMRDGAIRAGFNCYDSLEEYMASIGKEHLTLEMKDLAQRLPGKRE